MVQQFTQSYTAPSGIEILSNFYLSSWQPCKSAVPMLLLRFIESLAALSIFVWCVVEAPVPQLPIYLTTWGIIMVVLMTVTGLAVSICAVLRRIPEVGIPPWYVKMYWVIFNMTVSIAVLITLLYWRLLSKNASTYPVHHRLFWLETALHGFNSVIVLLEFFVSRTPVRMAHIYQPILLGFVYAVFSKIYQEAGGTNVLGEPYIYEVLDWSKPRATFTATFGSMIILIFFYVMLWTAGLARDTLSKMCCGRHPPTN